MRGTSMWSSLFDVEEHDELSGAVGAVKPHFRALEERFRWFCKCDFDDNSRILLVSPSEMQVCGSETSFMLAG
ncbi:hypothetical protein DTO027B5_9140 [Paecilomyces variotii]|nr:hypothetical protein DTO169C6_9174 [Paecilomyces variotii]KAJ9250476.1 hypothetical protein DTO207G8_6049 [Paecilomyces variotii]KAJ9319824.1 hypothetical protein DTO027B3_9160 [Paecilomyces variotii]KAJ9326812.1 hypothetical protein DTO027B5_9140 [Paecilomyces variotii]KAJ9355841.1 hypothetical protein DTO280E4_6244 [Paecilomyces variotii]